MDDHDLAQNVSRVLVTEDIEGFGVWLAMERLSLVSCSVRGSVRVWYDALFLRNMFSTPLPGDREMCDRFY